MGWIFGKKQDLALFTGPVLLALIMNLFSSGISEFSEMIFLFSSIFLVWSHTYSSFWHAYGYQATRRQNLNWLIVVPLFHLTLNSALFYFWGGSLLFVFASHFTAYHFIKQQQAWFHISAAGGKRRIAKGINKNAIVAVTAGLFMASLCQSHHRGWYLDGDLVELPDFFYLPILTWVSLSVAAYAIFHLWAWKKDGGTNWASHHIFIVSGLCWWLMRLGKMDIGSGFLVTSHHGLPYLFLGYQYIRKGNLKITQSYHALPIMIFLATIILNVMQMYGGPFFIDSVLAKNLNIILFQTVSTVHFTFDMFIWSRTHNPGWTRALSRPKNTVSMNEEKSLPDLAA
jgi:hypothetical protein